MFFAKRYLFAVSLVASAGVGILSCGEEDDQPRSSFDQLQDKIFNTSCTLSGCHGSSGDATFVQHQLVLAPGEAYSNLVGVEPANTDAKNDGLLRVKSNDPHNSLLYRKLIGAGHGTMPYGNPMPMGLALLTVGQVEFIRLWIEAGAPERGIVADSALLNDTTPQEESFEPLIPPAEGQGIQMTVEEFPVQPNFERELFVYKEVGNAEDIFVNRIEIKMRQNSHHFILYDISPEIPEHFIPSNNVIRDLRRPDGSTDFGTLIVMEYHMFIVGTQAPYLDYQLPPGVAIAMPAGISLDCNSHYVNKSNVEIEGEIFVNLHTTAASNVTKIARAINFPNYNLNLPAKAKTTMFKTFLFDKSVSVITLTSHTHQLAEKFTIRIKGGLRDGEVVYTNLDWHHPPMVNFTPPISLSAGQGLTSEIIYNNTTDATVSFGLTSKDEMGIIFGYYTEN